MASIQSAQAPDLSLQSHAPQLGAYLDKNLDDASFALYTLVALPPNELGNIANLLNEEWMSFQGNEGQPLVRIPSNHNFAGKRLKDIVDAHIQMDKEETPRPDGDAATGDLGWYPSAFLVVTTQDWKDKGLLFVYADKERGDAGFPMDKFFFRPKDGYLMLSSISFGDEECARSKDMYAI